MQEISIFLGSELLLYFGVLSGCNIMSHITMNCCLCILCSYGVVSCFAAVCVYCVCSDLAVDGLNIIIHGLHGL